MPGDGGRNHHSLILLPLLSSTQRWRAVHCAGGRHRAQSALVQGNSQYVAEVSLFCIRLKTLSLKSLRSRTFHDNHEVIISGTDLCPSCQAWPWSGRHSSSWGARSPSRTSPAGSGQMIETFLSSLISLFQWSCDVVRPGLQQRLLSAPLSLAEDDPAVRRQAGWLPPWLCLWQAGLGELVDHIPQVF